jgi:oligoendopeptidase F
VPSVHPYVLLNYTSRRRDVLTLAHELGHGVHFALAASQGIFQQDTPLTLAETASVFGETLTFGRLLEEADARPRASRCSPRTSRTRSRPSSARSR